MRDAQDAVKEIMEWPVQKYLIENEDGSIEFSDNKPGRVVCSKDEFMAEKSDTLERRSEVDVDADSAPKELPFGWHGECTWARKTGWVECIKLRGKLIARKVTYSDEWVIKEIDETYEFRPLKSDRERWIEAARAKGFKAGPASRMYDALISGELPTPEGK